MLVLNFMYMKKNLFRFSSRRFLFATVMAFALVTGAPQAVFAKVVEVQAVSQTGVIKGKIVDSYGEPVIGATAHEEWLQAKEDWELAEKQRELNIERQGFPSRS